MHQFLAALMLLSGSALAQQTPASTGIITTPEVDLAWATFFQRFFASMAEQYGLSVPAIFCYSFFKNRLTRIAMDTSNLADDLLTQMYHNSKKTTTTLEKPAPSGEQKPVPFWRYGRNHREAFANDGLNATRPIYQKPRQAW